MEYGPISEDTETGNVLCSCGVWECDLHQDFSKDRCPACGISICYGECGMPVND